MQPRELVPTLIQAALDAADPAAAVARILQYDDDAGVLTVENHSYDLHTIENVYVVGVGKAGATMAQAVEAALGGRITAGLVITKYDHVQPTERIEVREAAHPVPDDAGVAATQNVLALLDDAGANDLVLTLISGGGSALLVAPAEGLTLADLQITTDLLLGSGATINELNAVRKHLSAVKGGRLAQRAAPARIVSLILSDVVGSSLDVIASGPTAPDSTTFRDAVSVLDRYELAEQVPAAVRIHLNRGSDDDVLETPGAEDPVFEQVQNVIVASNVQAAEATVDVAENAGYNALLLTTFLEGEAREVGIVLSGIARELAIYGRPVPLPACIVLGGETTVTIRGDGKGGRNQELALSAALHMDGVPNAVIATLATDGGDGPTDAAGAIVDGDTAVQANEQGVDLPAALAQNDSYTALDALDILHRTGPTGTNVNDLAFVIVDDGKLET